MDDKKTKNDKNNLGDQKSALEQAIDQAKRYLADYQNLEKRTQGERFNWIKTANKDLIMKFLPVLDDLYSANNHLQDKGLGLIVKKFFDILNKEGLTELPPAVGRQFVPESMRSIAAIEAEDEKDGRVVEQIRAGYKLNGEVIRPTEVIVGKKKGDSETSSE